MGFNFPEALLFLFVLPLLIWVLRRGARRTKILTHIFRTPPPPQRYFIFQAVLVCFFVGSLVVAGAKPYIVPRVTGDYIFLSDVSRSMLARHSCSEPTFLERSRQVMHDVLTGVQEGRFGIVAFARLTFPITQMTYDHAYLHDVIDEGLNVGMIFEATATGIPNALSVIARKKEEFPGIYGDVEHVILLSDGHMEGDWQRELEQAIGELQKANVKVLAVGIGDPGETPIPRMTGDECTDEFLEVNGRTLRIPLRDDLLGFIAGETQGEYFGEGGTDELITFIRDETLDDIPEHVAFDEEQQNDVSWVFLFTATIALFGFLVL